MVKQGLGVPLEIGVYPGVPLLDSEDELKRKVEEELAPGLLSGLTGTAPAQASITGAAEPLPGTVVYRGSLQEVQEYFHENLWTDGLPVMPPTQQRSR